jgi:V/A-type H+/Na+-transporting ATPase subunit E
MEQQIQDLINSIKKDGIDSATNESKRIIEEAEKKAETIISQANAEKEKLIADGMRQLEKEKESFSQSLKMAARDLSLSFKKEVEGKIQALLDEKVKGAFDEVLLKDLLKTVIEAEFKGDVTVELPQEKKTQVASSLASELASSLNKGVELSFSSSLQGGFRVIAKDGRAFIDLSDDEVTKLLYPYLSSSVRDLI